MFSSRYNGYLTFVPGPSECAARISPSRTYRYLVGRASIIDTPEGRVRVEDLVRRLDIMNVPPSNPPDHSDRERHILVIGDLLLRHL